MTETCKWKLFFEDEEDKNGEHLYEIGCTETLMITNGKITDEKYFIFCPNCGRRIIKANED